MGGAAAYIGGFAFSFCVLLSILFGGYACAERKEGDERETARQHVKRKPWRHVTAFQSGPKSGPCRDSRLQNTMRKRIIANAQT